MKTNLILHYMSEFFEQLLVHVMLKIRCFDVELIWMD